MSFAQLTLTSPFLAGESHCIRIAPGHNWPLWELSPRMSLWPPELEYACGITLGRSYDSRTFLREKGAPEDGASQSLRGARTVSCACGRNGYRTGREGHRYSLKGPRSATASAPWDAAWGRRPLAATCPTRVSAECYTTS